MVFSYNKLRGAIREKYGTQDNFAKALGMARATLNLKLSNTTEFTQSEILTVSKLLGAENNFDEYFFCLDVSKN